jgi:hypothetical protein
MSAVAMPGQPSLGRHNEALDESRSRILRGATWKKQRVVVIIPAGETIPAVAAMAMWNLMFPPNQAAYKLLAVGDEVGVAYSAAIEMVLGNETLRDWEYVLTMEHDNVPPQDGLLKLMARMDAHPEYACIGGLYWTKGETGVPQIWGDVTDPVVNYRPQPPAPEDADMDAKLVECCGTGMGFNLWRLSMFKDEALRRPWFKTVASGAEGVGTQDLYAWNDFRRAGYRCAIDCDVKVGHLDLTTGIIW